MITIVLVVASLVCSAVAFLIDHGTLSAGGYGQWLAAALFFLAASFLPWRK